MKKRVLFLCLSLIFVCAAADTGVLLAIDKDALKKYLDYVKKKKEKKGRHPVGDKKESEREKKSADYEDTDESMEKAADKNEKEPAADVNIQLNEKDATTEKKDAQVKAKKEFISVRRKKDKFTFRMGFSLGGIGYGVVGPRSTEADWYRIKVNKDSFEIGFRGGFDAMFYITRRHCITVGAFYEQRKIQLKVIDRTMAKVLMPAIDPVVVYFLPFERYIDKRVVDLNYITFPVTYRYHIIEEFYMGVGVDIPVVFQAKTFYGIIVYDTHVDLRKKFTPIDFGARLVFGFTMNRVFVELALGVGIFDVDRMKGERRSMYGMAMIGYRI